jgi:hypothetical protein
VIICNEQPCYVVTDRHPKTLNFILSTLDAACGITLHETAQHRCAALNAGSTGCHTDGRLPLLFIQVGSRRFTMKRFIQTVVIAAANCGGIAAASTLDTVKQSGSLSCGGNGQVPGFGLPDTQGNWTGLDVDFSAQSRRRSSTMPPR